MGIARHFNAGFASPRCRVPEGRPKTHPSAVPSGREAPGSSLPALKRRAIIKTSLRDYARLFSNLLKKLEACPFNHSP